MDEPIERFAAWLAEAEAREPNNPSAMSVATVDAGGRPSLRMVLLRGFDARGFVFYTNLDSRKGRELRERPYAALCFHWKSLERQVRIEGPVEAVSAEEADAYFASRPKDSQIGAWASKQSQALTTRFELESRVAKYSLLYGIGKVPRPPFWSGYRVLPDAIEFWEERPFRLHDRTLYKRSADGWTTSKLFP
ncbi:MAG TPA: pyridoxamine 5'-phosphate oxidase [Gammaproteobacteria bacterium]|nr:pyridoxamine 5'-phosphate oxidase [Gammaproteobacteria bacterium]